MNFKLGGLQKMKNTKFMGLLTLMGLLYYIVRMIVPNVEFAWECVKTGDWKWIPITVVSCLIAGFVGHLTIKKAKSAMAVPYGILTFLSVMFISCCIWHFKEFLVLLKEGHNKDILTTVIVMLAIVGVLLLSTKTAADTNDTGTAG